MKRSFSLSPAPLGESPFGEDLALAEVTGRLPIGARASLIHVRAFNQLRVVSGTGVPEVGACVLE